VKLMRILVAALAAVVTITALLADAPASAAKPKTVRRSLGLLASGTTSGTVNIDAWNLSGKSQKVVVDMKFPVNFVGSLHQTQTLPAGSFATFVFSCPNAQYCAGRLVVKSSPSVVLTGHWYLDGSQVFGRPGDWARV
jgi:hypothetical protein